MTEGLRNSSRSVNFILFTSFLNGVGWGLFLPVYPDLLRNFTSNPGMVAQYIGYLSGAYSLTAFLFGPALGVLADRFGRRPVLLLSLFGAALDSFAMAFAPSLLVLFLARAMAGAMAADQTVASAVISDMSTEENRAARFGKLSASLGLGYILGPVLGGFLTGPLAVFGTRTPFMVGGVLYALNFLIGLFIMRETLVSPKLASFSFTHLNPFPSIYRAFQRPELRTILIVMLLLEMAERVSGSTWAIYNELKFGWTATQVGWSFALVGAGLTLIYGWGAARVIPKFGEMNTVRYAALLYAFSLFGFCFATKSWMMIAFIFTYCAANVLGPALQSLFTRQLPSDAQGEFFGVASSMKSVTVIIGPVFYGSILHWGVSVGFIGAAYFVGGLAALSMCWVAVKSKLA